MKQRQHRFKPFWLFLSVCLIGTTLSPLRSQDKPYAVEATRDVSLTIHLRGVHQSKVSLLPFAGGRVLQAVVEMDNVQNGSVVSLQVPADHLPGEFVLRFDYKEEASSTPYPSEKKMVINQQNLELKVNPRAPNNPDSTFFQEGEKENTVLDNFMQKLAAKMEMPGLLQQFLLHYDEIDSPFYLQGMAEYEKRRNQFNGWIKEQQTTYSDLFVSRKFAFHLIPEINWTGSEIDRRQSLIDHYFDPIDFNDPVLLRINDLHKWMDSYVNLYGELATTVQLRDSLFALAGQRAIEKAKAGHPKVYGWMVDYFFNGYESNNIQAGTAMLEPYLNDPRCLTSKRQAIQKRLEGMEKLVPGTLAPDFTFSDKDGKTVSFHQAGVAAPFKLLLFWSADCGHCVDLAQNLHKWFTKEEKSDLLDVFAISLDDADHEKKAWEKLIEKMPGWRHLPTKGGVNSPEAALYYILATPVMILVDAQSNAILAMPESVEQLASSLK